MYSKQPLLRPVTAIVGTRGGGADGRGPCACPPLRIEEVGRTGMHGKQPLSSLVAAVVGTRGGGADVGGPCACPRWVVEKVRRTSTRPPRPLHTTHCPYNSNKKRGDGDEHRTSSAAWEIRVTGTPGTWWHGGGLESAGYAITTPCSYQAAPR